MAPNESSSEFQFNYWQAYKITSLVVLLLLMEYFQHLVLPINYIVHSNYFVLKSKIKGYIL